MKKRSRSRGSPSLPPKARSSVGVVSENANGAEISNPRGVVEIRGDQPTRHWLCDRRPRAELSFRLSLPSSGRARTFAVGTALTGGPPHRSQRALLTHWAPTSGHDAQSLFGIRVQCSMLDDCHQPSVVDGIEESTDVRVEYPVHFLVNRAPLSRQATCRIRSSAFRRSGDRT